MEQNCCLLDDFSGSVIQYFNEILIHENCVLCNLRKHCVKNEDVEFSFYIKPGNSNCEYDNSFDKTQSPFLTEEVS